MKVFGTWITGMATLLWIDDSEDKLWRYPHLGVRRRNRRDKEGDKSSGTSHRLLVMF